MAYEVRRFAPSIPAGTAIAAPVTVAMTMPARLVRRVSIRFPPGPSGQVGVQLASSGVQIVPWDKGTFLVGENETLTFDLFGQIESGAWQLIGYNLGAFAHQVYVTFEVDPPQLAGKAGGGAVVLPLTIEA